MPERAVQGESPCTLRGASVDPTDHNSVYIGTDDQASALALPKNTQHMKVWGTLHVAALGSNIGHRQKALGLAMMVAHTAMRGGHPPW